LNYSTLRATKRSPARAGGALALHGRAAAMKDESGAANLKNDGRFGADHLSAGFLQKKNGWHLGGASRATL
jgi:hypothetical protein